MPFAGEGVLGFDECAAHLFEQAGELGVALEGVVLEVEAGDSDAGFGEQCAGGPPVGRARGVGLDIEGEGFEPGGHADDGEVFAVLDLYSELIEQVDGHAHIAGACGAGGHRDREPVFEEDGDEHEGGDELGGLGGGDGDLVGA